MKDCLKFAIINKRDLDLRCFSPKYYLNLCNECEKQKRCKIVKEKGGKDDGYNKKRN